MAGTRTEPGGVFRGDAEAVNTGANVWLPSDAPVGPVRIGVHLFERSGTLIDLDFARVPLPRGVPPGQSIRFGFSVPAPPPGEFRLGFDLVSEGVCWFEVNGAEPVMIDVAVGSGSQKNGVSAARAD
jgi:hypothetical protein